MPSFRLAAWAEEALAAAHEHAVQGLPEALEVLGEDRGRVDLLERLSPLRPYLLLVVARHYGPTGLRPICLAAAIQMIHVAALLHERLGRVDPPALILRSAPRGGSGPPEPQCGATSPVGCDRASAPGSFGSGPDSGAAAHRQEALDILLGDFFFARASGIIIEDGEERIIEDMIRTSLASAEAQAMIAGLEQGLHAIPPDRGFAARADKISLLVSLALRTGAILGGASAAEKEALSAYGFFLGRALRILQDQAAWRSEVGRPWSSAVVPPRSEWPALAYSHPMLVLREKEGHRAWEEAAGLFRGPTPGGLHGLRDRLRDTGCHEASLAAARLFAKQAVDRLQGQGRLEGMEELREVATGLVLRPPVGCEEELW